MKQNKPIQLSMPKPCSENWDEMTVSEKGKFCGHCQKQVIDFTKCTDEELYSFFKQINGPVCGRLYNDQLNWTIVLPPQPHNRLYRIAIALGLTLLVAQTPSYARKNPPLVEQNVFDHDQQNDHDTSQTPIEIKGKVVSTYNNKPFAGVVVRLTRDDTVIGRAVSDSNGIYSIRVRGIGKVNLDAEYPGSGFEKFILTNIIVSDPSLVIDVKLNYYSTIECTIGMIIPPYLIQSIDKMLYPMNTTLTGEELKRMGGN